MQANTAAHTKNAKRTKLRWSTMRFGQMTSSGSGAGVTRHSVGGSRGPNKSSCASEPARNFTPTNNIPVTTMETTQKKGSVEHNEAQQWDYGAWRYPERLLQRAWRAVCLSSTWFSSFFARAKQTHNRITQENGNNVSTSSACINVSVS